MAGKNWRPRRMQKGAGFEVFPKERRPVPSILPLVRNRSAPTKNCRHCGRCRPVAGDIRALP